MLSAATELTEPKVAVFMRIVSPPCMEMVAPARVAGACTGPFPPEVAGAGRMVLQLDKVQQAASTRRSVVFFI